MSSFRERNDRNAPKGKNRAQNFANKGPQGAGRPQQDAPRQQKPQQHQKHGGNHDGWLWGVHAVEAALKNPSREGPFKLFLSEDRAEMAGLRKEARVTVMPSADIGRFLPQGAVHQGVALHAPVLEGDSLDALMLEDGVILMLDQVTDPQNIGAIFRSAAAFGVTGMVMQDRHSPPLQGVLAKTAAGAIDQVPFARVTNLSRSLEALQQNGYVTVGLAGEAEGSLRDVLTMHGWGTTLKRLVLVMGSEGEGLRRLVAEHCDSLAKIPMPGGFESLNVSHATAIALYEACAR